MAPTGIGSNAGLQTQLNTSAGKYATSAPAVAAHKWNHVVVVLNIPDKTLSTYLNGVLAGEAKNVEVPGGHLFGNTPGTTPTLLIGKPRTGEPNVYLNAKLHDFRIYRIPLTGQMVMRIYNNALKKEDGGVRVREEADKDLPRFPDTTPQLFNNFLTSVPDIQVETTVGHLPRLPRYVTGVFSQGSP